jgi:arylsulfatase A-like enzyme
VFESPHSPFDPPQPFDRMYDNFTIPEPLHGEWQDTEDDPAYFRAKRIVGKWGQLSEEVIAESRRRYYGLISHIDYELGRFLGELRTKGLYDNTAIIFNSDHGEHLGDHGLFGKTTFLSGSGDVPFIVRLPAGREMAEPTLDFDDPILTADLFPTVMDLAGLEPDTEVDGISLLPAIASGRMAERIVCGECSHDDDTTVFATDGRYKYVYYYRGGVEQLFDIAKDRENLHNLAHLAQYDEQKARLRTRLLEYLTGFERSIVADGDFASGDPTLDEKALHARNPWAWRGPMRWGQGYGGGW